MSSGWNGIKISNVGKIRIKLAEMISQLTGGLVFPEDIQRTNPINQHYEDCIAWDCYVTMPAQNNKPHYKIHVYSWDDMGRIVKNGIAKINDNRNNDREIEVCAKK